jgi:PAS domain S-box-containing protein
LKVAEGCPSAGVGVFVAAGAGELLWANDALREVLRGTPAGPFTSLFDAGPANDAGEARGSEIRWPAPGEERTVRLKREPSRWFSLITLPRHGGEAGSPLGVVVARAPDVFSEAGRRERELYLERALVDSADAFVSLDNEGRIRHWNDGARLMFGYAAEEVQGRPYDEVLVPVSGKESGDLERIDAVMDRDGYVRGYETTRLTREGRSIPVELTITRLSDEMGRPAGRSVIYRDISDRLRLESALRKTVEELKEANQNIRRNQERLLALEKLSAIGEMSARVAHEIRTPLVTIGGFANTLLREIPEEAPARRYLEIIREEVRRLEAIVSEILEYVRPARTDLEPCDVNEILVATLRAFAEDMSLRHVEMAWRLAEGLPTVPANRYQIQQVFSNLMHNAVQSMPEGGRLTVATESGANHVKITIADTGVGIPEQHRRQIFKPFFTTKASGSGLGLAISSQIVAQHNGTMSFESAEGRGTTFEVRLPLSREAVT